jgi:hypothetical protein
MRDFLLILIGVLVLATFRPVGRLRRPDRARILERTRWN